MVSRRVYNPVSVCCNILARPSGREGWEAVAYAAQSDTVLLKKPANNSADRKTIRRRG